MELLSINEKRGANYVMFELNGSINSYTISDFQTRVYAVIKESNLVLDLSTVFEIDSVGMGVIMGAFNDGLESGKKLFLLNMSPQAQITVSNTGFIDAFNVISSVAEVY